MRARALAIPLAVCAFAFLAAPATPVLAQSDRYTVSVEPDYIEVPPGAQIQFKAILFRKGQREFSKHDWEWFAVNGGRFDNRKTRFPQNVFVAPNKPGKYYIEVTTDRAARLGNKARAEIVVKHARPQPPAHQHFFRFNPRRVSLKTGESVRFSFDSCGCQLQGVRWWAGRGGHFTPDGIFTAGPVPGTFRIVADWNGLRATAWIQIESAVHCAKVALQPAAAKCYVGESIQFTAQAWDQHGNPFGGAAWGWQCDGGAIANGIFTAGNRPGRYRVLVIDQHSKCAAEAWIEVLAKVQLTRITIEPTDAELYPGERVRFKAQGWDQHGNPYGHCRFEWHADGGHIGPDGLFTAGPNPGRHRITVFDRITGQGAFTTTTIKRAGAAHLVLQPRVQRVAPGEKIQLVVEYYDERLNPIAATGVTFGCDGGFIDGGWWLPRGCTPGQTYKVWVKDSVTGASDQVLVYVTRGRGRGRGRGGR